jgi:tetratricopeptide (TPR) repeat protein
LSFLYLILPLFALTWLIARTITTFFHETGHAIPALIFTREKVTIYLGSYGDEVKSVKLNLSKKIIVYFKFNPFKWKTGMVRHAPLGNVFYQNLLILIMGPLMSLLIASIALWIVFEFDFNGFLKLFSFAFFCSAVLDLLNTYPSPTPIVTVSGSVTYCDGYQIAQLFKFKKDIKNLYDACDLYEAAKYKEALFFFEKIKPNFVTDNILNVIIHCYIVLKQFSAAKTFYSRFADLPDLELSADTLCNLGTIESYLNENELAIGYYTKALTINPNQVHSLCNLGYTYNITEKYDQALPYFDKAISVNPDFAYAYSNRGFTKIGLKQYDDALADINKALQLDDKDAYAYRNLGIYYMNHQQYDKALEQLQIAFEIDPDTHQIVEYLKTAKENLA